MTADLSGVWPKFDRACEHFGAFEALLATWVASNGPTMRNAIEDDRWHVYRWVIRQAPDLQEFAVVTADMFHNLRAALDHLVYQLVIANGQVPKPKQNSFPVVLEAKHWLSAAGGQLNGLSLAAKDKIKKLQPFDPDYADQNADTHMLVLLDRLNNIYKHRLLPVGVLSVTELELKFTFPENSPQADCEYHFSDHPVVDGAEFYRFRFTPDIAYWVQVAAPPELRVWFDDLSLGHRWEFADMVEWVRQTIQTFEPESGS